MATTQHDLKQRVVELIETLPEDALAEVATFVEYHRYKGRTGAGQAPLHANAARRVVEGHGAVHRQS